MRAIIGRVAAVVVGAAVVWVADAAGVHVSPDATAVLTEGLTMLGLGIWLVVYAVGHKLIDRRINPGDVART
jgi:hypothetical protein